mmetsp:Transcript_16929/g.37338  ORF Transcript_16929/g.37338 Transcript_16929/m.37338 type:complete len:568 (+) Transcript_16929:337-2040(+)
MAPRRDRSGSGSFVETMSRRRASLDSEIERPSPLAFVRKGSAGAAGTAIGEIISGGRSAGSAAANPPPPPPRQERGQRRPTVTGAGWRPTHAGILSRRLSQQHDERNNQSVLEYHQIFASLKSSDPTAPAGALHQRTMAKIASLRAEEGRAEEEARLAELRALQNETRLNRLVRGVAGLAARGGAGPQLDGSDRSHDGASPRESTGTPASTPVLGNGRQTFIGRPALLGMPGLNGAVSRGIVDGFARRTSQDAQGSSRAGFDWNARDDHGNDHAVAYEVSTMPLGGFLPGNGGHREASGKGNLAPRKSVGNLTFFGNDDQSRGDANSASAMSDISGLFLDETDNTTVDDDEEEDLRSRSARHHELAQIIRASRASKSSSSSTSSIYSPTPNKKGPTPNEEGALVLQKMSKLQKDEPVVAARSPRRPGLRRRRYSATAVAALAEPSLLSTVQSEELENSSSSHRCRRRHSLAPGVEYDVPLESDGGRSPHFFDPDDPHGQMHVQVQSCDLESGRILSSASGLALAETPGSYHAGRGGDALNRSDHTGYRRTRARATSQDTVGRVRSTG